MPTDAPQPFSIDRAGAIPIEFDGWLIGEATSRGQRAIKTRRGSKIKSVPSRPRQPERWTEVRIYRTVSDKWVCELIGKTLKEGERDLITTTICDTPKCVQDAVRVGELRVITATATRALTQAAEADARLASVLTERI